jgi:hypothetical protein
MLDEKKELKKLGKYHLKGFLGVLLLFILLFSYLGSVITFNSYQRDKAKNTLEPVVEQIQNFKKRTGSFPNSLDLLLNGDISTRLGLHKYKLNIYEVSDSSFKVGWDVSGKRVYYDSQTNRWIDNMSFNN